MITRKTNSLDHVDHIHFWTPSYNLAEQRCKCGSIRVSKAEAEHRINAWKSYYQLVRSTPSYLDFEEMRLAYHAHDYPKMMEIKKRIQKRTYWSENEFGDPTLELKQALEKPKFPDPVTFPHYLVV